MDSTMAPKAEGPIKPPMLKLIPHTPENNRFIIRSNSIQYWLAREYCVCLNVTWVAMFLSRFFCPAQSWNIYKRDSNATSNDSNKSHGYMWSYWKVWYWSYEDEKDHASQIAHQGTIYWLHQIISNLKVSVWYTLYGINVHSWNFEYISKKWSGKEGWCCKCEENHCNLELGSTKVLGKMRFQKSLYHSHSSKYKEQIEKCSDHWKGLKQNDIVDQIQYWIKVAKEDDCLLSKLWWWSIHCHFLHFHLFPPTAFPLHYYLIQWCLNLMNSRAGQFEQLIRPLQRNWQPQREAWSHPENTTENQRGDLNEIITTSTECCQCYFHYYQTWNQSQRRVLL